MAKKIDNIIAENLKRLRIQKGWSQATLAKFSGLNKNSYSKIERAERLPNIRTLEKLAKALHCKSSDILPF